MMGLPHGSVLGPTLFNRVMAEPYLVDMGITSDLYADDTRLWVSFGREDKHITRRRVVYAVEVINTL